MGLDDKMLTNLITIMNFTHEILHKNLKLDKFVITKALNK